jgi:hypothetical protein
MVEKTQAIFEINKGTNKLSDIGVNDIVVTGRQDVCLAAQKPSPLGSAAEGV